MDLTIEHNYLLRLVLVAAVVLGAAFMGSQSWHFVGALSHRLDVILGGLAQ